MATSCTSTTPATPPVLPSLSARRDCDLIKMLSRLRRLLQPSWCGAAATTERCYLRRPSYSRQTAPPSTWATQQPRDLMTRRAEVLTIASAEVSGWNSDSCVAVTPVCDIRRILRTCSTCLKPAWRYRQVIRNWNACSSRRSRFSLCICHSQPLHRDLHPYDASPTIKMFRNLLRQLDISYENICISSWQC